MILSLKNWLEGLLFLFIIVGYAHATIDVLSYPQYVYFTREHTKTISPSFSCSFENESVTSAYVQFSNFQKQLAVFNGYSYSSSIILFDLPSIYGNNTLRFYCYGSNGSEEIKEVYVNVYKLSLSITSPTFQTPLKVYQGDFFYNVVAKVNVEGEGKGENISSVSLYLRDASGMREITQKVWAMNDGEINIAGSIPYTISPAKYDLIIKAQYSTPQGVVEVEGESNKAVEVLSPLSLFSLSPEQNTNIEVHETKDIEFKFKLLDKGEVVEGLTQNNIKLKVNNDAVTISSFSFDPSTSIYTVKATIVAPKEFDNSAKSLYMYVEGYKDYPTIKFKLYNIHYVVEFKGSLMMPDRNVANAQILLKGNMSKVISTSSSGAYDAFLLKGKYNVSLRIRNDEFYIEDTDIEGDVKDPIKYDEPDIKLDWINVVESFVLELSLPYKEIQYSVSYDDKNVLDERKLSLYKCSYWNFGKRVCGGKWEEIKDVNINIGANKISFKDGAGAYALVEKDQLLIDGQLNRDYFFVGDDVTFEGIVKNLKGDGVKEVKVQYKVQGTGIAGEVITDDTGKFSISFSAPKGSTKISSFTLYMKPLGEGIEGESKEVQFKTEKSIKLVAYVDDVVQVTAEEPKDVHITLKNEGDLDLTNIEIRVAGIKQDWYILTPIFIEAIKPGEESNITLRISIPKDYCSSIEQDNCKEYYFVNMRFKAQETTEDISFTLRINRPRVELNKTITEKQSGISSNIKDIKNKLTGLFSFSSNTSNINYYIVIGFLIVAFILITIKKRRSRFSRGLRFRKIPRL